MGAAGSKRFKSEVGNDEVVGFNDDETNRRVDELLARPAGVSVHSSHGKTFETVEHKTKKVHSSELSISDFVDDVKPQALQQLSIEADHIPEENSSQSFQHVDYVSKDMSQSNHMEFSTERDTRLDSLVDKYSPILSPMGAPSCESEEKNAKLSQRENRLGVDYTSQKQSVADSFSSDRDSLAFEIHQSSLSPVKQTTDRTHTNDSISDSKVETSICPEVQSLDILDGRHWTKGTPTEILSEDVPTNSREHKSPYTYEQSVSPPPPDRSFLSPLASDTDEDTLSLAGYGSIMQKVRTENQSLLELQRKRTMSTMNNAKLEMEVEVLMKQLEYLDKLEADEEVSKTREVDNSIRGVSRSPRTKSYSLADPKESRRKLNADTEMRTTSSPRRTIDRVSDHLSVSPIRHRNVEKTSEPDVIKIRANPKSSVTRPHQLHNKRHVERRGEIGQREGDGGVSGGDSKMQTGRRVKRLSYPSDQQEKTSISFEYLEESVDEESSAVDHHDSQHMVLSGSHVTPDVMVGKSSRSKNVLRSVNRRHRHSADPDVRAIDQQGRLKSSSTDLSAPDHRREKKSAVEISGPHSEPKVSGLDFFPASKSRVHDQQDISSKSERGASLKKNVRQNMSSEDASKLSSREVSKDASANRVMSEEGKQSEGHGGKKVRVVRRNREKTDEALRKRSHKGGNVTSSDEPPSHDWSKTMDMRKGEVELLLRRPINSDEDIQFTLAASEAGLIFMDELDRVARSLSMLRGSLSRWLLPYDNNTAITDQMSSVHSVVESMPDYLRGKLTEKQVHYLVSGVNGVRQLIRIKIADDNDLDQARQALQTAADFLKRLQSEASSGTLTPYELLKLK